MHLAQTFFRALDPHMCQPAQCHQVSHKHSKINMPEAFLWNAYCPTLSQWTMPLPIQAPKLEPWACPRHLHILTPHIQQSAGQLWGACELPKAGLLSFTVICPQAGAQCLSYGKYLRNICWMNGWIDPLIDQGNIIPPHGSWVLPSESQTCAQSGSPDYHLQLCQFALVTNYPQKPKGLPLQ